jgi:hypothetical protein
MRRGKMLMNRWLVAALCACAPWAATSAADETLEGLLPYESNAGATVILTGLLTQKAFKFESMRVVGSRLAGRPADPDQFRISQFNAEGKLLDVMKTWSPLLSFEWDVVEAKERSEEGHAHEEPSLKETAHDHSERHVEITVPASIALETVALSWPEGREIARIKVGEEIRRFCERTRGNAACEGHRR